MTSLSFLLSLSACLLWTGAEAQLISPTDIAGQAGENVTFMCTSAFPGEAVNNVLMIYIPEYGSFVNFESSLQAAGRLWRSDSGSVTTYTFGPMMSSDNGTILRCTSSLHNSADATIIITFRPNITRDPASSQDNPLVLREGEGVVVSLIINANPQPTSFIWRRNGQIVTSGNGIILDGTTFTVEAASRELAGNYTLEAVNTVGSGYFEIILVIQPGNCTAETILSESGISYSWPITSGGETATLTCPLNSNVIVTRNWSSEGSWQNIADYGCTTNEQLEAIKSSFTNLTNETYGDAVAILSVFTEATVNNTDIQTAEVLSEVTTYFQVLADFVNESNIIINMSVIVDAVRVVNSFLQWAPENIKVASSSSMVESFENIVSTYAQQLSLNETQTFTTLSLTVVATLESIDILTQRGRSLLIGPGDSDPMLGPEDQIEPSQLSPQLSAAVSLPATLFERIDNRDNVGIFFALHEASTLLPAGGDFSGTFSPPRKASVGSHILAATVGSGINFQNLDEPVTVLFQLQISNSSFIAQGTERCVSWDFTLQDWTTNGCATAIGGDGVITCTCNHLTNFAILVDICLRQEDCEQSRVEQALTYISYIGISVSIVCLIFTIFTLLIFKKIRDKDISKYHIQLCFALLCMFLLSLILVGLSAEKVTTIYGGCISLSLLVHYFTLVSVMWMGAEALLMFQKLVIVFVRITTKFIVVVSVICWTVPIAVVLIPFLVDMANSRDDESDIIVQRVKSEDGISYCFLSHIGALIGAFLAPILVIIIFNTIIFIWVVVVVSQHARKTAARKKEAMSNKQILRMTISISGVLFLFGLTWLFFILTISVPGLRETFQILFTIFNSLQGFFVFAFILFTEGFDHWKAAFLSCRKSKLKPTQAFLRGISSSKNKSTDVSTLSKSTSETPHNISTIDHEMNTKRPNELEALHDIIDQSSTDIASPTELIHNNEDAIRSDTGNQEEETTKKTNTHVKPLKVLIKHYSTVTKKSRRHQVEEANLHFYHEDSSSSDEDGGATDHDGSVEIRS